MKTVTVKTGAPTGAVISPYYDSLLVKVTTWDNTFEGACRRAARAAAGRDPGAAGSPAGKVAGAAARRARRGGHVKED